MKKILSDTTQIMKIIGVVLVVFVLNSGVLLLFTQNVSAAYSLLQSRSIELSDASPGVGNVSYTIQFTPSGTTPIGGIVVDFCSNDTQIGNTCNPPTSFNVGTTPNVTGYSTSMGSGWTAQSANLFNSIDYRTLILTNSTPITTSSTTPLSFVLNGVNNPTAGNTTFYARILTYGTGTSATSYTATSVGTPVDAGGVAISTTNTVNIDFQVQETLTFCVYTGSSCAGGGSSVLLGDNHGVLSATGPFVDKTMKYDVATNANSGVIIRLYGGSLTSGSYHIPGITTPTVSTPGTSQFGVCTYASSGTNLIPYGNYDGNAGAGGTGCSITTQTAGTTTPGGTGSVLWYFNTANTASTYGDEIASLPTATTNTGVLVMMANIASDQQAGVYTTQLNLIATGTY